MASAESEAEMKRTSEEVSRPRHHFLKWFPSFINRHPTLLTLSLSLSVCLCVSLSSSHTHSLFLPFPLQCGDLTAQLESERSLSADLALKHTQALSELKTQKQESEAKIEVRRCSPPL